MTTQPLTRDGLHAGLTSGLPSPPQGFSKLSQKAIIIRPGSPSTARLLGRVARRPDGWEFLAFHTPYLAKHLASGAQKTDANTNKSLCNDGLLGTSYGVVGPPSGSWVSVSVYYRDQKPVTISTDSPCRHWQTSDPTTATYSSKMTDENLTAKI